MNEITEDDDLEINHIADMISPANYVKIREMFANKVRKMEDLMTVLRRTEIFQEIKETFSHNYDHMKNPVEAEERAWDDHRMALKSFIGDNARRLEENLFAEQEEDNN